MAKTIKVYGTTAILDFELNKAAHQLGLANHASQVRLICGATSMAEANRLCKAEGMYERMFTQRDACTTGNKQELELAGNGGIFIGIPQNGTGVYKYYSIKELKENDNNG